MKIAELSGKNVCILGYGREGKAMENVLKKFVPDCSITIRDAKDNSQYLEELDAFDVLIKSPGIPPSELATAGKLPTVVTNTTQIFLDSVDPASTVIGVTGSKGKSTTASLIHHILTQGGKKSVLLGNIGEAAIEHVDEGGPDTIFVFEMSSYQLMDLTVSPRIAVITSFFPEHLNYHGSLEAYMEAKKHITRFQKKDDLVFYYADNDGAEEIAYESKGTQIPFTIEDSPVAIIDTNLAGTHNLGNIAGAYKVARHLGIDEKTIVNAIRSFKGLPHRLETIGLHHGVQWIDDAISTTPESTIAAIHALSPEIDTLLVGGQDRGFDYGELGAVIADSSIRHLILFPDTGSKVRKEVETHTQEMDFYEVTSMENAVEIAKKQTASGKICLLSPAAPSYNRYKNFEEKGEVFALCIRGE